MKLKKIIVDSNEYFGIELRNDTPALRKNLNFKKCSGFLVKKGFFEEWFFNGIISYENKSYIYFSLFKGRPLKEIITLPAEEALKNLIEILHALKATENKNILFNINSVYFLDDNALLFFPADIMSAVENNLAEDYKTELYLTTNHYLTSRIAGLNFSISAVIYKIFSGEYPFEGKNEEEINQRIRNQKPISLKILNPKLKNEISDFMDSIFKEEKYDVFFYDLWIAEIKEWFKNGLYDKTDASKNKKNIQKEKNSYNKKLKRKLFWEKNWKTVLAGVIISAGLLLIGTDYVLNIIQPKSTKGLNPEKVVKHYYNNINRLDNISMNDAVIGNAGKDDINEALVLFIREKNIYASDNIKTIIPADEWLEKGKPPIKKYQFIYGVSNLKISKKSELQIYEAEYDKWIPYTVEKENNEKEIRNKTLHINDKLHLKEQKGYWMIYKIERLSETEKKEQP